MPKLTGARGRSAKRFEPSGEINVTPFIDVMLVLLLVFMIAAPISTVSVPVDLPTSSARATPPVDKPVTVSVRRDLSVFVGETHVTSSTLAGDLSKLGAPPTTTIFLRVDRHVEYGDMMAILDTLRRANYLKVSLVGLGVEG